MTTKPAYGKDKEKLIAIALADTAYAILKINSDFGWATTAS